MLGKRKAQRDLFSVGNVFPVALDPASSHGQLARAADRLFREADFAAVYADRLGRPSAPPSLLALLTLLQHESGCSDAEAIDRSAFVLDLAQGTVTCPGGRTTAQFTRDKGGDQIFHCGRRCQDCPLRAHCTTAVGGRTLQVHPQEALLQAARAAQQTPTGREQLRERVVVEHRLARLGQLGVGPARYRGRRKSRFQLLVLATIANLRWTWNWERALAAPGRTAAVAAPTAAAKAAPTPVLRRYFRPGGPRSARTGGAFHGRRFTRSIAGFRPRFLAEPQEHGSCAVAATGRPRDATATLRLPRHSARDALLPACHPPSLAGRAHGAEHR